MRRTLCLGLFVFAFLGLTAAAQADVANFQANCSWNASFTFFTCVFDGQRPASNPSSCSNGASPQYFWNFGDGNSSSGWSYSSTTSHVYAPPPSGTYGYWPTLSVLCDRNDGSTPTSVDVTRYMCVFGFGVPGCIQVNGTWN
jgi:hypothetical protein